MRFTTAASVQQPVQHTQMAAPPPGADFLELRLARATAVPHGERSPDVAAFVESMQLTHEAVQLLPLTPEGRPALPAMPATRRKVR